MHRFTVFLGALNDTVSRPHAVTAIRNFSSTQTTLATRRQSGVPISFIFKVKHRTPRGGHVPPVSQPCLRHSCCRQINASSQIAAVAPPWSLPLAFLSSRTIMGGAVYPRSPFSTVTNGQHSDTRDSPYVDIFGWRL